MLHHVTDLECPGLWEIVALGHYGQGPEGRLWSGCVRLPGRETNLGGCRPHSSSAVLHTVGSHTGHHLQEQEKGSAYEKTGMKAVSTPSFCKHTLPELGQRCLKSSFVSKHRARPFISKHPFSGRRSEYSF